MRDNGWGTHDIGTTLADPNAQVDESACWRDVLDRLAAACVDDIERAILRAAFDMADAQVPERDQVVAAEFGVSKELVRRRRRRMFARAALVTEEMAA